MTNILRHTHQIRIGKMRVLKLMQLNNLQSVIRRKRPSYKLGLKEHLRLPNILNREFITNKMNFKYVTDITYIPIPEKMVYLSVILDLCNREVVSYQVSLKADATLSLDTVAELNKKRDLQNCLIHSDQGIHYTNKKYVEYLSENGIIQSMSRRGNCFDNAVAENFFSHFKCECIRLRKKAIRRFEDAVEVVDEYINYYNTKRPQTRLGGLSPKQYLEKANF